MNFMIISMDSLLLIFFLFACFSLDSVPCSASELSYHDHCGSFVPEATPTVFMSFNFPLGRSKTGYYTGGDKIGLDVFGRQNSFYLQTSRILETDLVGVYKYEASLTFRRRSVYYRLGNSSTHAGMSHHRPRSYTAAFSLHGFWSESSGKLCMIGRGSNFSVGGNLLQMDAVLKLYNVFTSSNISSYLISGSFESLNSETDVNYFGSISLYMLPRFNYKYTLDAVEANNECSSGNDDEESSSTIPLDVCSAEVSRELKSLRLEYSSDCISNSTRNCSPFRGITGYLPSFLSLDEFECYPSRHRLRAVIGFYNGSNDHYNQPLRLNPGNMLIGEGWWDDKKNQLCVVACHFVGMKDPLGSAHVDDCSVRISLRVPSVWSIKDNGNIVGQIWSNKTVNASGYFNKVAFRNDEDPMVTPLGNAGLKYKYSQLEKVKKLCPRHKSFMSLGRMYPDALSSDMTFDISVISTDRQVAQGYGSPFTVDDQFFEMNNYAASPSYLSHSVLVPEAKKSNNGLFNISYKIIIEQLPNFTSSVENSFFTRFSNLTNTVKISAEGIYNAETGSLCMVGCQNILSDNGVQFAHSGDCEILVKFQLPPLDTDSGAYMKGSIKSTRNKLDPLYFDRLELSSRIIYREEVERTFWRTDMEIIMVLMSTTLACGFVGLQLYHVKRHPNVLPFISVFMLLILTLGYMVPLVLNFEAVFTQNLDRKNVVLGSIGWLEVNEITVRLMTMVAFLLQCRLLLLTWSARKDDESNKELWIAEKKAFYVTLSLYAAGFLVGLLLKHGHEILVSFAGYSLHHHSSMWEDSKSYGGLVLDGFLLPQMMLNLFMKSRENALSFSFNFGITFVRLLPHAYDLCRAHNTAFQVNWSYFYADPSADFYSTAWDIVISLGALLFAVIIYLQQRFGDRCILPWRYRESQVYEMVPITRKEAAEAEAEKPNV